MNEGKNDKISKALMGNSNAEKWTEKDAISLYDKALEIIEDEEVFMISGKKVVGFKYDFIGELIRGLKKKTGNRIYRELLNRHLLDRFPVLKPKYEEIIKELETNCYSNTKKGIINTAVGIINLKSNHKWTDRIDSTTKDNEITNEKVSIHFVDK